MHEKHIGSSSFLLTSLFVSCFKKLCVYTNINNSNNNNKSKRIYYTITLPSNVAYFQSHYEYTTEYSIMNKLHKRWRDLNILIFHLNSITCNWCYFTFLQIWFVKQKYEFFSIKTLLLNVFRFITFIQIFSFNFRRIVCFANIMLSQSYSMIKDKPK